jgi:hypothetical protein
MAQVPSSLLQILSSFDCFLGDLVDVGMSAPLEDSFMALDKNEPVDSLGDLTVQLVSSQEVVVSLPRRSRVKPGGFIDITVTLRTDSTGSQWLPDVLDSLSRRCVIRAILHSPTSSSSRLFPEISAFNQLSSVVARFNIPADAPEGSIVSLEKMTVAGEGPREEFAKKLPFTVAVSENDGIEAPFVLSSCAVDYQQPCVADNGMIFIPKDDKVYVFDGRGNRNTTISLTTHSIGAVAVDSAANTLFVRDKSAIVALRPLMDPSGNCAVVPVEAWRYEDSRAQLWPGNVAVLPELGVMVYAHYFMWVL